MNKSTDKYLPIGTVVLLRDGKKRLMITGFCAVTKEKKDVVYDYIGCLYPEGVISSEQTAVFNHDQIAKIYAFGYSDDEQKEFITKLKEEIDKSKEGN